MAQLMERDQVGKAQQLADLITNIEAESTPVTSMARKESKPKQNLIEFQAEVFDDVGHQGVVDGKDVDSFQHQQREKLYARGQKVWHNPSVSDFAEETTIKGLSGGEMAHQKAVALIQVKRKIERRALANVDSQPDNGLNPYETRGLPAWIQTTAQTDLPVPEAVRPPAGSVYTGTLADFTEDALTDVLEVQYNIRKSRVTLDGVVASKLKRQITGFSIYQDDVTDKTAVRTFNQNAKEKSIIRVVDKLSTDFGDVRLHLSSYLYTDAVTGAFSDESLRSGLFLDMRHIAMAYTRMPRIKDLEDRGGGPRSIVDAIFALLCYAPHAQSKAQISS
jgi:hypothetical protein